MSIETRKQLLLRSGNTKAALRVDPAAGTLGIFLGDTEVMRLSATAIVNMVAETLANDGLKVLDAGDDNTIGIVPAADEAADRTITIPALGGDVTMAFINLAQTISALWSFSVMPKIPSATVAAAGSSEADAAAITTGFTLVTAANATKGVILPAAAAGLVAIVKNDDAANAILKVYPNTGDGINALTVTTGALSMAAKTCALFVAYDATTWYTLPLLPS